jgi:hypothetical protein
VSDDRDDRPRLSWREIDRRRGGTHVRRDEPRGRQAEQEKARSDHHALQEADALFSLGKGGSAGEQLAKRMQEAHGGPEFLQACRQYREEIGVPSAPALLSLFLDSAERDLIVEALEALVVLKNDGSLELSSGLRSQLRALEQDRDDTLAGISEELLQD